MRLFRWLPVLCLLVAACSTRQSAGLQIAGSTSVQPLTDVLAKAYARQGGARVSIQGGGSTAGVQAVLSGVAQMGAVSRRLTAEESARGLVEHIIAHDVLAVVVHPDNPLNLLTRAQLRRIFDGSAGGAFHLISREAGSGSREAFRTLVGPISPGAIVQNSSGGIRVAVAADPKAIGYVSLGVARMGGVKVLKIDGRRPGEPGYPLSRPLSLVTRGNPGGEAAAFLRFVRSPAGQKLIEEEGLVPQGAKPSNR